MSDWIDAAWKIYEMEGEEKLEELDKKRIFEEWLEGESDRLSDERCENEWGKSKYNKTLSEKLYHEGLMIKILKTKLAQSESILELEQKAFEMLRKLSTAANKGIITRDVEAYEGIAIKRALNQINIILGNCRE